MIIINKIFNFMFNNFTETELTNERWKDIEGYDGMYQVSDLGRVRSKHSGKWKVLRPGKTGSGYLKVNLCKDKQKKNLMIHRLVAQAFIPNDDETKTQINHINEDKEENRFWNLEWCSALYNNTYNDIHHRRITKRTKVKDLYDPNLTYDKNLEIFRANGVECSTKVISDIRKCLNLKQPKPKRDKVKKLYDPNLSIDDNIKLFKEQGIECSYNTVQRLRNDLGITRKHKFRNELQDLYDQNLSYDENLKVFKENGVECSKKVIINLRKDLGLIK